MSSALVSRFLAFAAVGGRSLAQYGDEFARVMGVYGDDFARHMANGSDDLVKFIQQNGDDIARQAGDKGDDFLKALRGAAPGIVRHATKLSGGLDDVMRGFQANADKFDDFATYLRSSEQAIRSQYGDTVYTVLNSSAPQIQSRIATTAGAAADDVARAAGNSADDFARSAADDVAHSADDAAGVASKANNIKQQVGATTGKGSLSFMDRMAIRHGKIGIFSSMAVAGAVMTEFATKGAISTVGAHATLAVADKVREIDPELAEAIADKGLSVLAFGSALYDTPRNAAVNAGAIMLEEQGHEEGAMTLKLANITFSPSFYVDLIATDKGERAERFITKLCEESGVEKEQIKTFLQEHPIHRGLIEEQLGIDLTASFDGMEPLSQANKNKAATAPTFLQKTKQGVQDNVAKIKNLSGEGLRGEFNRVVEANDLNMFSSMNMFMAVVCGFLSFLGFDGIADHFRRAVVIDATVSQYGDRFNLTRDQKGPAVAQDAELDEQARPDDPLPAAKPGAHEPIG